MRDLADPGEARFTQPELKAMLADLRADLAERRQELIELERSEVWLADQLDGTRRKRVAPEQFRSWAQQRADRFTAQQAAAALGCSVGQARTKLRALAAAGTLNRYQPDSGPEQFSFAKPEAPPGPRRRPRGDDGSTMTYASAPIAGTGGGSSRGRWTTNKAANQAIAEAVGRGWSVVDRGNGLLLVGPHGQRVWCHKTPGEGRAVGNLRGEIRRAERDRHGHGRRAGASRATV